MHFVIFNIHSQVYAIKNAILLTPMSSLAKNTPMITVASSGAEEPAAMKVAPATSGDNRNSVKKQEHIYIYILLFNCIICLALYKYFTIFTRGSCIEHTRNPKAKAIISVFNKKREKMTTLKESVSLRLDDGYHSRRSGL